MSDFTIFTGKTVDDAIQEACKFFTTEREKLEVEIISGGSTGIFGLVGKKKAQVKARRRQDPSKLLEESRKAAAEAVQQTAREKPLPAGEEQKTSDAFKPQDGSAPREATPPRSREGREPKPHREPRPPREPRERKGGASGKDSREQREAKEPVDARPAREVKESREARPTREAREPREAGPAREAREPREARPSREARPPREAKPKSAPKPRREQPAPRRSAEEPAGDALEAFDEPLPLYEDKTPASQELLDLCREVLGKLLAPILEQQPDMTVEGSVGRISVTVRDEEHSGLLIGREGQTLAALQYLANRILARKWPTPVRLQINTGDYREKQDENLRKMAIYLADKAKSQGRAQSTKPLSSYHRRVVHMALQADDAITTRSKGDGPMKRVIILPKRGRSGSRNDDMLARAPEVEQAGPDVEHVPASAIEQAPGLAAEQAPGAAGGQAPGATAEQTPGATAEQTPGATAEQTPGAADGQTPGADIQGTPLEQVPASRPQPE